MLRFILFRVARWIPSALFLLFVVYAMAFYGAGDPIRIMFLREGGDVVYDEERLDAIRESQGLNDPFLEQFGRYLGNYLTGNMGYSLIHKRPILEMIAVAAPVSIQMGLAATLLVAMMAIPAGVLAALNHNSWLDNLIVGTAQFFWAIPVFVAGPLLMVLLVLGLKIMDVPYGWHGLFNTKTILPLLVLSFQPMAIIIRQARSAVLEVLGEDYIRTARAKGIPERVVVFRHILRPVLTPVVTQLGLILITIINGAMLLEVTFGLPGLGLMTVNSVTQSDYPAILAIVLIGSFLTMMANLFVDVIYPLLDPRAAQPQRGSDV
jgi:ABC-type dipeptide/oligopeptide/nickel transport system permease component